MNLSINPRPGPVASGPQRRGFFPVRDLPTVLWLLAAVLTAFFHQWLTAPRWLMIHLLLLGAVSHAILVWSTYFADALLHTPTTEVGLRNQNRRLLLLNLGVIVVIAGVLSADWWIVVAGAAAVAAAVGWHALSLWQRSRRALGTRFGATIGYYVTAAALLPVGVTFGVLLAREPADPWHDRLVVAHAAVNVLGWIGLTVVGTLMTLWPTMLRTRIVPGAERAAARALPVLIGALAVIVAGALLASPQVVAVGVVGYLVGLGITTPAFVLAARARPPTSFPTWSVLAGIGWLLGSLITVAVGFATSAGWSAAGSVFADVTPLLAAAFAGQVLLGALSYLVPVALGGGPSAVRVATGVLDRGAALRIVLVNVGILLSTLPAPTVVRVIASAVALVGLASFIPLLLMALRASRRVKAVAAAAGSPPPPRRQLVEEDPPRVGRRNGQLGVGLAVIVLAVAAGVAMDPAGLAVNGARPSATAGIAATGQTTTVAVAAKDMRFTPDTISVPAGNRLVIVVTNTDDQDVHDLVLDSGADSGRLRPGQSATVDAGVIGRNVDGWCSVLGHRQMGMVLTIEVTGRSAAEAAGTGSGAGSTDQHGQHSQHQGTPTDPSGIDFMAEPPKDFVAHDATLPSLSADKVHRVTFDVEELDKQVAPGVTAHLWTYNGSAPGPLLHGRVGDTFEVTLVNNGTIGHSIDFHAGALAPDRPMRTIAPGESLLYTFTATKAGIWMYHCSSMPMSAHIANGLFGAVVIEPDGLPPVDRSYVLVQSELYLGANGEPVDVAKLAAEKPDAVVFNGYVNQYDHRPLTARVGERVRIWVLDAGPNRPTSFHVVGGQFDTVWAEGHYLLRKGEGDGGSQALGLMPAQGGFVELTFPEAGHYPFVSHLMVDAERGAHGVVEVTG
ncbi:multicopper oxidase domain-containing protein [Nakamurella lactea]|uniref:multicopper oxidase domain-containing protein n=1 Tax=Nakamurella lactea TaxID=459515 RepID=UPI0004142FB9|nr:multicopper oxidase domain-containing protein [Nakamurella lactea]